MKSFHVWTSRLSFRIVYRHFSVSPNHMRAINACRTIWIFDWHRTAPTVDGPYSCRSPRCGTRDTPVMGNAPWSDRYGIWAGRCSIQVIPALPAPLPPLPESFRDSTRRVLQYWWSSGSPWKTLIRRSFSVLRSSRNFLVSRLPPSLTYNVK